MSLLKIQNELPKVIKRLKPIKQCFTWTPFYISTQLAVLTFPHLSALHSSLYPNKKFIIFPLQTTKDLYHSAPKTQVRTRACTAFIMWNQLHEPDFRNGLRLTDSDDTYTLGSHHDHTNRKHMPLWMVILHWKHMLHLMEKAYTDLVWLNGGFEALILAVTF